MLTIESLNLDKPLSVFLAVQFAERALAIWEAEYPEDMRPRKAIEAAKEWLKNPFAAARDAAYAATNAAAYTAGYTAANAAANAAANTAANAAYAAADNAAYSAYSAYANAAYSAAANAARALGVDEESLTHEVILENLDFILQYKIDNGQNFAQPELIFSIINEEQADKFLFNLEALR